MTSFFAFLSVSAIVIATPGPDTAITVRNTLLGDRSTGAFTALGIASGQIIWAFATSLGVVALLVASEPLFLAIKYGGAAYLIYLGLAGLREAIWPTGSEPGSISAVSSALRLTPIAAFRQGILSDLANPKMAVFFASLLPQFVPAGGATFSALMGLGSTFALMTFAWLTLYATVIAEAGDFMRRSAIRRSVEAVTGTILIGLGVRIATEQR